MRQIRAINGNVLVRRDADITELHGMAVGENAVAKALTGEVVASDSPFVAAGDRVHIPHQRAKAMDYSVDGMEFASVKGSDLFAVEKDGTFHPVNRYVLVRKCVNDHIRDESGAIALYMTDNHIETTNWVEILEIAEDCELYGDWAVGMFCVCPERDDRLQRIGYTKDFCVHEELVKFVTDGK